MRTVIFLFIVCFPFLLPAQQKQGDALIDSLLKALPMQKGDTNKVLLLNDIARNYSGIDGNAGVKYADSALAMAKKLRYKVGMANAYTYLGSLNNIKGDLTQALKYEDSALKMFRELGSRRGLANSYYYTAVIYGDANNAEALKSCDSAFKYYKELGEKHGMAICNNITGGIYYSKGDYLQALECYKNLRQLSEEIGFKAGVAAGYHAAGVVFEALGNYPEAMNNLFAALKIDEELGQKGSAGDCYNSIGTIYQNQKNYSEALKNFYTALKMMEAAGTKKVEAGVYQNIAAAYDAEGDDEDALKNYSIAKELNEKNNDKNGIGDSYLSFGGIYEKIKNYPDALKNYQEALKIFRQAGSKDEEAKALTDIGHILCKQKKYAEAEKFGLEAVALAKRVGAPGTIRDADEKLSEVYEADGNYRKSLEYYKAFVAIRDSMFNEEATKKTVQAQMRYDFGKKEAEAKAEQQKKDSETKLQLQRKNMLIYTSLSALIAFVVIGMMLMRQRKLKANQQKTELEQKQLRAQMNPHFIFNCLNSIQHFVVINDVKNANKYLTGFASLMRQTLENSKDGIVSLHKELAYLDNYLTLELMRFKDKFTVEISCAADIDTSAISIPSMIIQPFVENAIRHGLCFLKERNGKLSIKFYLKGDRLYCEIDDNGIGRAQSQKLKEDTNIIYESQGMALTKQRLALVSKSSGSEYTITIVDKVNQQNEPGGTTVIIKFPVEI